MAEKHSILVPTDFSACAEHALLYAFALARATDSVLHFAHVVDPLLQVVPAREGEKVDVFESVQKHAMDRLRRLQSRAGERGIEAVVHVDRGTVVEKLIQLIEETGCAMVVIATHGHSGFDRFVFGSTCDKLVRRSPVPMFVVKHPELTEAGTETEAKLHRVLCPIDFSEFSHAALPRAESLTRRFKGTLVLAHVVQPYFESLEYMPEMTMEHLKALEDTAAANLHQLASDIHDLPVETKVLCGVTHRELVRFILETHVDLVVLATHGRSGVAHLIFGSVAEKLLHTAPCPVLTIRPDKAATVPELFEERHKALT